MQSVCSLCDVALNKDNASRDHIIPKAFLRIMYPCRLDYLEAIEYRAMCKRCNSMLGIVSGFLLRYPYETLTIEQKLLVYQTVEESIKEQRIFPKEEIGRPVRRILYHVANEMYGVEWQ